MIENNVNIVKTTDYAIFKFIEGNRNISPIHVFNLKESISRKNLLHLRPIIVNEEFYVLDGQHRLFAAKELYLPIYYFQINSKDFKEISLLNKNQKNWKIIDYINFYAKTYNNLNYQKLLDFTKEFKCSIEQIFIYLNSSYKKKEFVTSFQEGNFLFDFDENKLRNDFNDWNFLFSVLKEKDSDYIEMSKQSFFRKALYQFLNSKRINKESFWQQLNDGIVLLSKCYNFDQCIDILLKIYNRNSRFAVEKGQLFI